MTGRRFYKNSGARFKRADGTWIEQNAVFEPTGDEVLRLAYKLQPYAPPDPPPGVLIPDVVGDDVAVVADDSSDAAPGIISEGVTDGDAHG